MIQEGAPEHRLAGRFAEDFAGRAYLVLFQALSTTAPTLQQMPQTPAMGQLEATTGGVVGNESSAEMNAVGCGETASLMGVAALPGRHPHRCSSHSRLQPYAASIAISGAGSRCGMRRTMLVQFGIHQFASPKSFIRAGTRRARMTVASKMIPAARPIASDLTS